MKHFLIYTNHHKDPGRVTTDRIKAYLENKGQKCTVITGQDGAFPGEEYIPKDACCMIVLGGDGTMLRAAWDTKKVNIPLIGVNMGTLGYMTEVEPENLEEALDKLISGEYEMESRMMLHGTVIKESDECCEEWALNDVVISRSGSLKLIKLDIYVNGRLLSVYNADGMIVTTSTGSTGYSLSAGGPIVNPVAKLIMLTPICAHTLNSRSIILSPDDVIEIRIPSGRQGEKQKLEVNFDGAHVVSVETGDRIHISKSDKTTEIIKISKAGFLDVLHKKMSE